jgi:hypothetical protein
MWSIGDVGQRPEKSKKKQLKHEQMTPIDLLVERLAENGILHSSDIAEANELFKQQIIDSHENGVGCIDYGYGIDYYNETFKSNKQSYQDKMRDKITKAKNTNK